MQNAAIDLVIVAARHAHTPARIHLGRRVPPAEAGIQRKGQREPEGRTFPQFALDSDSPPIISTSCLADGQAQSGSAEPPGGGGVGLSEPAEYGDGLVGSDADAGVLHAAAVSPLAVALSIDSRWIRTWPVSVNLTALPTRFARIWRMRPASPITRQGKSEGQRTRISRPFLAAMGAIMAATSSIKSRRSKGVAQCRVCRLDLGEVEYVVDDGQQCFGAMRAHLAVSRCSDVSFVSSSNPACP